MKIAVGSQNPVKVAAVSDAFSIIWPDATWEVIGIDVPSGVSNQPMSDRETIRGATNRAKRALRAAQADFAVGVEGGLHRIGKRWFDCGWMVVMDRKGKISISSTIRSHTPRKMINLIEKGYELGTVNDLLFKKKNSKQSIGHFGLMTRGQITRRDGYRDAVIMALSAFLHPELFTEAEE